MLIQNDNAQAINQIKKKLDVMTKSPYRTTNFSLIEYFAGNNFQPINISIVIVHLVQDYKLNPTKYVLSNENTHFKSEKTFETSIKNAIKKNKSFIKGPGDGQLSLDFQKTLEYLETMFSKYKNNSKDIKTPIKIPRKRKNNENKKLNVLNIKHEKSDDDSDYEINSYRKKKMNNNDFHSPEKAYHPRKNKYYDYDFKKEKEDKNQIYSIKDSDSDSYPYSDFIKKEVKKEEDINSEWTPDIFNKDLIRNNLTSSLDKNAIANTVTYINKYAEYIEENDYIIGEKETGEVCKKLEEIKNYLVHLCENKDLYDILCDEVKNWQNEIFCIYKVMQSQLNAIKIEISNKTYSYDAYSKLRDILINYEAKYDNAVDSIISKINELIEIEKNSAEKQLFIKRLLNNINIKKKLINSIENAARINDVFSFNQMIFRDFPNYNYQNDRYGFMNTRDIVNNFQLEKNKIIDVLNDIDNDIGNISI